MADEEKSKKEPLKPVFVSPAEAFDGHLEKHHNIGSVTPEYLKGQNEQINAIRSEGDKQVNRINQTSEIKPMDVNHDTGVPTLDRARAKYRESQEQNSEFKEKVRQHEEHKDKVKEKNKDKEHGR